MEKGMALDSIIPSDKKDLIAAESDPINWHKEWARSNSNRSAWIVLAAIGDHAGCVCSVWSPQRPHQIDQHHRKTRFYIIHATGFLSTGRIGCAYFLRVNVKRNDSSTAFTTCIIRPWFSISADVVNSLKISWLNTFILNWIELNWVIDLAEPAAAVISTLYNPDVSQRSS